MELSEPVVADRSERGKLRLTGPQRAWFLHQVLTQAFEDISSGEARVAAMITPHGRMQGYLEVLAADDACYAHFEAELREELPDEIRRYVFATRVEIDDVTEDFGLLLVAGPDLEPRLSGIQALIHRTDALGSPAAYLWLERSEVEGVLATLEQRGCARADESELEAIRIANGVPRWGRDMDAKTIPQEVGIDTTAVHYDKGCYLGQEAMAKIHFRGRVNRRLRRLESGAGLEPGSDVLLEGEKVGRVTSASDGRGLALLRATVREGTNVTAGSVEATVVD